MINLPEVCHFLPRCHKAVSRCRVEVGPPLLDVAPGHPVACYNPVLPGA